MLKMFVIRWKAPNGRIWESERYAASAKEALTSFRRSISQLRNRPIIIVLGISEFGARLSIQVV